jgi:hypothetical protein
MSLPFAVTGLISFLMTRGSRLCANAGVLAALVLAAFAILFACWLISTRSSGTGSSLHPNTLAEDRVGADPAVDVSAIVGDLIPVAANGAHEMQILVAAHFAQHDVTDSEQSGVDGHDGDELTGFDATAHGMPARAERDRLAGAQVLDVQRGPARARDVLLIVLPSP